MLRVLGQASTACDGITRRDLLRAGTLAALSSSGWMPRPLQAKDAAPQRTASAAAVILIDLFGGPSHIDTFDPKPDAPDGIRGEFATIPTALPGVRICECLPQLARRLDRLAVVRSVTHRYNSHNPYGVMTGFDGGQDQTDYFARPTNHPSVPSVCQYLGVGRSKELPGYMMLPAYPGYSQGLRRAGPYGGYLGPKFDPVFSTCEPDWGRKVSAADFYNEQIVPRGEPQLPRLDGGLTVDALHSRRSLVEQLEQSAENADASRLSDNRRAAFDLLLSPKARSAFDLARESPALRDRYGRDLFGQSVLLARRLVEAGVTFVTVHTEAAQANGHWDTHSNNFKMLRHVLLPFLDRALSALLDDLADRGLLDSTLVVVTGDMGRSPRVNGSAGRDHWPQCGFCLFAGGGTRHGVVHGASDKIAAFPTDHPVSAGDLVATVYHLVGVDPESTVPDHTGRPTQISHGGSPISGILK